MFYVLFVVLAVLVFFSDYAIIKAWTSYLSGYTSTSLPEPMVYVFVGILHFLLFLTFYEINSKERAITNEENAKRQQQHAEEEKEKAEQTERKYQYFAEQYYGKFAELNRIFKMMPEDYPDKAAYSLMERVKKMGMNLSPQDDERPRDVFIESIRHHNIDELFIEAEDIFEKPKYNVNQTLEKSVLTVLVYRAARKNYHVYGLPHPDYMPDQDSPDEMQYLVKASERFKHAYILGKTGAGKTTLLQNLITQDISRGDGVIVLSPEGALFETVIKNFPISRIDNLVLYDPTDDSPPLVSLNPMHLEDRRDLAREAGAVAGTLGRAMGDDLSGAMQTLLLKCAYTLLQLPNSSFQDVRELLKPVSPLRAMLSTHPDLDDITREYWRDEFDKGGHKRSAEALISRLDAFFMPPP